MCRREGALVIGHVLCEAIWTPVLLLFVRIFRLRVLVLHRLGLDVLGEDAHAPMARQRHACRHLPRHEGEALGLGRVSLAHDLHGLAGGPGNQGQVGLRPRLLPPHMLLPLRAPALRVQATAHVWACCLGRHGVVPSGATLRKQRRQPRQKEGRGGACAHTHHHQTQPGTRGEAGQGGRRMTTNAPACTRLRTVCCVRVRCCATAPGRTVADVTATVMCQCFAIATATSDL